jgi:hypothetical protein
VLNTRYLRNTQKGTAPGILQVPGARFVASSPRVIVTHYDGLKVRFWATLGEEPELEVGLV